LRNLVQKFGRTEILHAIDLDLSCGVFGILGPNGAGKTTLLRTLATVIRPTHGTVDLLGFDPRDAKERRIIRRKLGYLPQRFGYYPNFTVSEFVEYFALLKEMPHERIKSAVAKAIERVDLSHHVGSKLGALSGGMLRRAGIAQAIVNEPELLLLDEPTAGLDPEQRVAFRELTRELGRDSTVVLSTHLVEDVAAACTDIALLARGEVIFCGTPSELSSIGEKRGTSGDTPLERGYGAVIGGSRK
jgi:ABC-type multidrug transport system ATPase subunit